MVISECIWKWHILTYPLKNPCFQLSYYLIVSTFCLKLEFIYLCVCGLRYTRVCVCRGQGTSTGAVFSFRRGNLRSWIPIIRLVASQESRSHLLVLQRGQSAFRPQGDGFSRVSQCSSPVCPGDSLCRPGWLPLLLRLYTAAKLPNFSIVQAIN